MGKNKKFFVIIILGAFLAFSSLAQNVNITVNSTNYQTIEGIGGGTVYYLNWVTAHANKQAIYDTIFTGLGLTGLRIGNWAQELNKDLSVDVEIINAAKARLGNDFFIEMSSWSAPASLKANNSLNGTNGGIKASLKKENGVFVYDQFGTWWKQSLEYYHSLGVYPDYISLQNEPDMDATYEATLFNPTESTDIASYGKALQAVSTAINGMTNEPKILGPEPLGVGWNATQNYVNALDKSLLDGYCFHYYHSGVQTHTDRYSYPDDFIPAMTGLYNDLNDKPMFMTENCSMRTHTNQDAINLAWLMANSFNVNHVSSYLFWDLLWGPDGGCLEVENPWNPFTTTEGFIIKPEYHAIRHYSKFIKQGWICIGVSTSNSDVVTAAFRSPQSDAYTVVMINKGSSSQNANISLPVGAPTDGSITQTVPSSGIWSNIIGSYNGSSITLPANSITTVALESIGVVKPVVSLTSPTNNSCTIAPATITLSASATDADGTISHVDFYNGTTLIVAKYIAPYTWDWINVPAGKYSITAKAYDNDGNETTSSAVIVGVQGPFGGTAHAIPGIIEFEDYDEGGNGCAYFDDSPGSETGVIYRIDEDVDIENCTDTGAGYSLGYTTAGEWLEYTVDVATSGTYDIDIRVASDGAGKTLNLEMNGLAIATDVTIPNTTGWQIWQTVTLNNITLNAGVQVLRVTIGNVNYVNLNYITFTDVSVKESPIVSISSPIQDQTFNELDNIIIEANASDPDGTVMKVTYYNGTNNLGEATIAPYTFNWNSVSAGDYNIIAVAIDNDGLETKSDTIKIKVLKADCAGIYGGSAYYDNCAVCVGGTTGKTACIEQTINLNQGWNLISINVQPSPIIVGGTDVASNVSSIFAGLDVALIKDANGFWKAGQIDALNSLTTITTGNGYLVYMNTAGILQITGVPVETPLMASLPGWNLIGYPNVQTTNLGVSIPISTYYNSTNCQIIKNFEGFWEPNGSTNSIQNFEPGKGYFLFK